MKRFLYYFTMGLVMSSVVTLTGAFAFADDDSRGREYAVTVTNLTNDQQFTPLLVASHREGVALFTLGDAASPELATLAEEGNTAPLTTLLLSNPDVKEVTTAGPLLDPGASRTVTIPVRGNFNHISVAAMLIPTNDAFFAVNGVEAPHGKGTLTVYSPAYDSGSEINDETCANIPGPHFDECGGPGTGGAPSGGEEGYVHIHRGIHGIGDINAGERDWRNPVAKITIERVR